MPFALVQGLPVSEVPHDLYIPPDALEVILDAFEGPLDLLLYLIRRQNLDILDIPITEITRQYIEYIEMLQDIQFELAAEYLVMAAILAEIKSRMLLPRPALDDNEESDPRAELVRRLQEYERFKQAAEDLDELPRDGRDFTTAEAFVEDKTVVRVPPKVELHEILAALKDVMGRAELFSSHQISSEPLSIRERMSLILSALRENPYMEFHRLFDPEEGRMGVVVSFLALLELSREQLVDLVQNEPFGQIYVKAPE
jgi:segregation and condensation protein A